jgi:hypothetical protein
MSQNFLTGGVGFTSSWSGTSSTLTTGVSGDPFGGANAARLTEDTTAASTHSISQSVTALAARTYLFGCFVAPGSSGTRNFELLLADATFAAISVAIFNPTTGALVATAGNVTPIATGSSPMPNGWQWVWMTANLGNFSNLVAAPSLASGTSDNYNGDGTSNLLLYGPILALNDDLMGQAAL